MPISGKTYSKIIAAAVFVVLEIAAVGLLRRSSTMQDIWLNRVSYRVLAGVWGTGQSLRNYLSLKETNRELAKENFALKSALIETQNALNNLKADSTQFEFKNSRFNYIPAQIIKISRNSQHNYIIINKGSEDGIVPHSGIVSGGGIVGIIDVVDKHYSYGITLMNSRISVSVRAGRDGIVAPLEWTGVSANSAVLKGIPAQKKIEKGDTVYTSGLSSVFPGDLPVGVISNDPEMSGMAKSVDVTLFQDFSAIKYVIATCDTRAGEISALEKNVLER